MNLDDEICYCFHVPKRKLINFARRRKLRFASQFSECHGAGSGCGWCVPYLEALFEAIQGNEETVDPQTLLGDITPEEYATARSAYLKSKPSQPKEA